MYLVTEMLLAHGASLDIRLSFRPDDNVEFLVPLEILKAVFSLDQVASLKGVAKVNRTTSVLRRLRRKPMVYFSVDFYSPYFSIPTFSTYKNTKSWTL